MKEGNNEYGAFYFLVDNRQVTRVDEWDDKMQASATINLHLTVGQTVQVQNYGSSTVYGMHSSGFMYSWFTGFLFYAL